MSVGDLGIWAQVVAILITARIGWVQLQRFNDNERIKNTFVVVKEYMTEEAFGSPVKAYNLLRNAALPQTVPTAELREYLAGVSTAYVVLRNYLDGVDDLYHRNLIDREFYLSRHCNVIKEGVEALLKFREVVPDGADNDELIDRLKRLVA